MSEKCGYVCGIPRNQHQTEEHPWAAPPSDPAAPLREAAQAFVDVWGETDAMESSATFRALRAALSPAPKEADHE